MTRKLLLGKETLHFIEAVQHKCTQPQILSHRLLFQQWPVSQNVSQWMSYSQNASILTLNVRSMHQGKGLCQHNGWAGPSFPRLLVHCLVKFQRKLHEEKANLVWGFHNHCNQEDGPETNFEITHLNKVTTDTFCTFQMNFPWCKMEGWECYDSAMNVTPSKGHNLLHCSNDGLTLLDVFFVLWCWCSDQTQFHHWLQLSSRCASWETLTRCNGYLFQNLLPNDVWLDQCLSGWTCVLSQAC